MNDYEILKAILDEIKEVKHDVNARFDKLESEVKQNSAAVEKLKSKVDNLKTEVKQNSAALEDEWDKMVGLLGESYQMTNQKIREMDLDNLKSSVSEINLLCRLQQQEILMLKRKIG